MAGRLTDYRQQTMKSLLIKAAKWLLAAAMDKALRDNLPKVFTKVDREVPTLLSAGASPELVTQSISAAISEATGKPALKDQIDAVVGLYSPITAAIKLFK
jgi:TnpA family transposase